MEALNKAIEIKPDYFEAISYINLLYREKAKIETDPVKKQEYTDRRTIPPAGAGIEEGGAGEGEGGGRPGHTGTEELVPVSHWVGEIVHV